MGKKKTTDYSFDEIVDRKGTSAYKQELLPVIYGRDDIIPLWVADMDFKTPPFILETIEERCDRGILGYTLPPPAYYTSIQQWLLYKHSWDVAASWIQFVPGVVPGIALAIHIFSDYGDKIMIQTPVYPPFSSVPLQHGRTLVVNPLILENGKYRMDVEHIEKNIQGVKMFILCNPHNPGGRVWSKEELLKLSEICNKNNVLVISDEIHADMPLFGHVHTPYASVSREASLNSITLMAPTKTFNMAGLVSSFSVIENSWLREKFKSGMDCLHVGSGNLFAYITTIAAYEKGKAWLMDLTGYLEDSVTYVKNFIAQHIPQIQVIVPEASFLIWLDCRNLGLEYDKIKDFMVYKAGLALNDGFTFGQGGEGFQRLNVACPRSVLEKAMEQLRKAVEDLKENK